MIKSTVFINAFLIKIFALFLCLGSITAQQTDTNYYTSTFEESIFKKLDDSVKVTPLEILLSIEHSSQFERSVRNDLEMLIHDIRVLGVESKKPKKQIQIIYKMVHDRMLNQYMLDADFNEIFKTGKYNCASASALYALVFDEFNIPYQIKELPTHVYIVGNPGGKEIMVESTDPNYGTYKIDIKEKERIVRYLASNKVIGRKEYESTSPEVLYEKYYNTTKNINSTELAALIYYNKGVFNYQNQDFRKAAINIEKSYRIYPSEIAGYMLTAIYERDLRNQIQTKTYEANVLASYLRFCGDKNISKQFAFEFFRAFSIEKGINNPDAEAYKTFYSVLQNNVPDTFDLDDYNQIYYRVLAYTLYSKTQYAEALSELYKAYLANPENLQTKEMIVEAFAKHIMDDKNHEMAIDSIENYIEIFPFLEQNEGVQQYYTYCVLRAAYETCFFKKIKQSDELLRKYEQSVQGPNAYDYDKDYLAQIYSNLSLLYIERNQISKALQVLKRGLKIEPTSIPLIEQINNVRQYINSTYVAETASAPVLSREEKFKRDTKLYLNQCWTIDKAYNKDKKRIRPPEHIEFELSADKTAAYSIGSASKTGKWSLRTKSRLLYLIPKTNKSDYTMLKIDTIKKDFMEIRSFNGKKINPYYITLKTCASK